METAHKAWEALRLLTADLGLKPQDGDFRPDAGPLSPGAEAVSLAYHCERRGGRVRRCLGLTMAQPRYTPAV